MKKQKYFCADEISNRSDYHRGITWAIEGQTSVLETIGKEKQIEVIFHEIAHYVLGHKASLEGSGVDWRKQEEGIL